MPGFPTVHFENQAGRLAADPRGFLYLTWHPNAHDPAARRELMEAVLVALSHTRLGKLLADQRFMVPFTVAEQQWIQEDWTPRAINQGQYRHRAILVAHDAVARLSSAAIVLPVREQISYCQFDNEAEAIAWLLAQ